MKNIQISRYNENRSYVYNKAFTRWFDNNNAFNEMDTLKYRESHDKLGGNLEDAHMKTRTGALSPTGINERKVSQFDLIREWADQRGLYKNGDPKTQALKLVEEVGETCRAILKDDHKETIDGIGDCVVVLTNLAELCGTDIEHCITAAYDEIKDRKGKMANGTYVKND